MSLLQWIDFPLLGDARGSLVAIEGHRSIPFPIKRIYYIFGTNPGVARGFHAHKKLEQVAVCIAGRCRMILDDGKQREEACLDSPAKALLINKAIWHEMHDFSSDCVLLVLADEYYDETDYIRDYEIFRKKSNDS